MTDAELQNDEQLPSVSDMLIEAREARGLSQKDVAEELFLTTTFIRYIDNGDFNKIPKPAFIKGYLRSYARVVSLDGNEVVARFEAQQQDNPDTPDIRDVTEEPVGQGNFNGPVLQTGLFGLVAVVIVVGIVWWIAADRSEEVHEVVVTQPIMDEPEMSSPVIDTIAEGSVSPDEDVTPEPEEPVDEVPGPSEEASGSVMVEEPPVAQEAVTVAVVEPEEAVPPVELPESDVDPSVRVERVRDGDTSYITVFANGDDNMEFTFSGECWVEIDDANGEQIYGDLNRAGDVMTVHGVAPFDVLLGRAPAVRMMLNGEEVDLRRFTTREETARVRTARL